MYMFNVIKRDLTHSLCTLKRDLFLCMFELEWFIRSSGKLTLLLHSKKDFSFVSHDIKSPSKRKVNVMAFPDAVESFIQTVSHKSRIRTKSKKISSSKVNLP
jgi:hypothetical protein